MRRVCGLLLLLGSWTALVMAQRTPHHFKLLTSQRVRSIMHCNDIDSLFRYDFPSILKLRVPGTPSHAEVKEYIVSRLHQLNCSRWNVTTHSFTDSTPYGQKPFTNIIATLDPEVDKRLVLVAHYDSKLLTGFLGATDSALPVALLLDLILSLDSKLQQRDLADYSLQLIFTDGEEAFKRWGPTDSIYGARQLAADMVQRGGLLSVADKSGLEAMEAFILFDLIGSTNPHPSFYDMYRNTSPLFQRFVKIEKRLKEAGHLEGHTSNYFKEQSAFDIYRIGDDHEPFLQQGDERKLGKCLGMRLTLAGSLWAKIIPMVDLISGGVYVTETGILQPDTSDLISSVPIVHLITYPFPRVWHTANDNADAIDKTFVSNFRKILAVFLHEYFHLR